VVFVATPLTDAALTSSPAYPELVRALLLGCGESGLGESGFGDGPLDRGAVHALERPDLPTTVEVATFLTPEGGELTRWLLLAALGLLGLEVALTRSRRPSPPAAPVPAPAAAASTPAGPPS
jgi:hypothetical protein